MGGRAAVWDALYIAHLRASGVRASVRVAGVGVGTKGAGGIGSLAGRGRVAKPVTVTALRRSGRGVGLLDLARAREQGDRVCEFGDVCWGDSNYHRCGMLLRPFDWVRLQEPGCEDLDPHSIRDGEGERREEVLLSGGM